MNNIACSVILTTHYSLEFGEPYRKACFWRFNVASWFSIWQISINVRKMRNTICWFLKYLRMSENGTNLFWLFVHLFNFFFLSFSIAELTASPYLKSYYIGMDDIEVEGKFEWLDGTQVWTTILRPLKSCWNRRCYWVTF